MNWRYFLNRFKEPSTYVGIGGVLASFGLQPNPTLFGTVAQAGVAVAGLIAVVVPEASNKS